jgi:hypothetical protein
MAKRKRLRHSADGKVTRKKLKVAVSDAKNSPFSCEKQKKSLPLHPQIQGWRDSSAG